MKEKRPDLRYVRVDQAIFGEVGNVQSFGGR